MFMFFKPYAVDIEFEEWRKEYNIIRILFIIQDKNEIFSDFIFYTR